MPNKMILPVAGESEDVRELVSFLEEFFESFIQEGVTSTNLLDVDHPINTRMKQHGLMVTTVDGNVTVWSSGVTPSAPWVNQSGVNVYVPV